MVFVARAKRLVEEFGCEAGRRPLRQGKYSALNRQLSNHMDSKNIFSRTKQQKEQVMKK
jgi:hypothetical protein